MNSYRIGCPLVSKTFMFIVSTSVDYNINFTSSISSVPSRSNQSFPIWSWWAGFVMVWFCTLLHFLYFFLTPLLVLVLFRPFLLLELGVILLVASILVGSCRLVFFFCAYVILYLLPCSLPLLDPFFPVYDPFYLVFHSFVLPEPVLCWYVIIVILPYIMMGPWCFPPLIGLLIASLLSERLHIGRGSVVFWVLSCNFLLGVFPSSSYVVLLVPPVFAPFIDTTIWFYMVLGVG